MENWPPEPAVAIVVFWLRFQLFCLLFKSQESENIFARADSVQKHMDVVVCLCLHLRLSLLAQYYLLSDVSQPTIALVNGEFNWQFKGCAFAIQFPRYLGTSWDHHPMKLGPLPVDFSIDARCLWKEVSISTIPLSHPSVFTVINYCS